MNKLGYKWGWVLGCALGLLLPIWSVAARIVPVAKGEFLLQSHEDVSVAIPQGGPDETYSFTFQGHLDVSSQPANGIYDFVVELWNDKTSGSKVADCVDVHNATGLQDQPVQNGLFTFYLVCDAAGNPFTGQHLWILVKVRPNGSGAYTSLPRQPIASTPYASSLYPGAVISGTITGPALKVVNATGAAVNGWSRGTSVQDGYAGMFVSQNYRGLYAQSQAGYYDAYFAGTGGIYASNYWSMTAGKLLAVNGGEQTLRAGDVLAIAGVVEFPDGSPVLAVRLAKLDESPAVVGVMVQGTRLGTRQVGDIQSVDIQPINRDALPGEYLAIVTSGLVMQVRVGAVADNLKIGDWLAVSSTPGVAMRSDPQSQANLPLLGKLAGSVDPDTGMAPVFVILR